MYSIVLQITRLAFNSFTFRIWTVVRLICQAVVIVCDQNILLFSTAVKQYKFEFGRAEWSDLSRPVYCFARFWWRVLLSCRLARLDLNSIQLSIAVQYGVLWSLHGRISSFWTSPGCCRRITDMSKSCAGDVSMRTTPGVASGGGKVRRNYFNSLHFTTWTDHAEPKTCFILALYRRITSSAVSVKSQRLRELFWRDSCPFSHRFEVCAAA